MKIVDNKITNKHKRMRNLQTQTIAIKELSPYERNARTHSEEQIEKIGNSIKEFGFIAPVIIDENNMILAGHGRVEAARDIGVKEVPYRRITNLTESQKKAYILADNKLSDMAGWDEDLLLEELAHIELDMTMFGFDEIEDNDIQIEEDDFEIDEEKHEAVSKRGELYRLGRHVLMCGDSTNANDVDTLMNGHLADLVVTDPPYNVNYEGGTKEALTIENDNMSELDFANFLDSAFANLSRHLKEGGSFYVWYASRSVVPFVTMLENNGLEVRQELIWNKNSLVIGRQDYQWKHEPCLYGWKGGATHYFVEDRTLTTVMNFDRPTKNEMHPTMKPLDLIAYQIKNSTVKGEIVLDLFGGSGSTLIACEQIGRTCYMMEYDPFYVDVIIERWETLTGEKAIKL